MAKVQINFTALHGAQYTLTIGDPTETATSVEGTRDVFTTTEEDDTDVFMPVRCTSGTVRFYNEGGAWSTLADVSDTHTPVVLSQGSSAVWSGYINKGYVGTRRLYGYNEECEICVQCPLSELDTVDYDPLNGNTTGTITMMKLGDIVEYILDDPFGDGVVQGAGMPSASDLPVGQLLDSVYVSPLAFYKTSTDGNGDQVYEPKYSKKEALEVVLRQVCCSARWTGTAVMISAFKPSIGSSAVQLVLSPADTNSEETAVMPFKKIRVTANVEGEDTPVEVPTSAISGWVTENNQYSDRMQSLRFNTGVILAYYAAFIHGSQGASDWRRVNDSEYTYLYGSQYATIIGYALDGATAVMPKLSPAVMLHDYDFTNVGGRSNPSVFNSADVRPHALTIQRTAPFFVYDAYLDIEMKLNINLAPPGKQNMWDRDGTVELYVVIGDKQYNHLTETWDSYTPTSAKNWFAVEYSNGELVKRNYHDWHYEEPQGFAIRADESLGGVMEVGIRSWHVNGSDTDIQKSDCIITIERFSVKTLHHIRSLSEKSTFTATGVGQGDDDIDLDFCSERSSGNGVNSLFFANGSIVRNIMVTTGVYARPEQWVADRHASMTTGTARSLIILRQNGNIAPGLYGIGSKVYDTLSISHEWAENITKAHLIEVGTSNN